MGSWRGEGWKGGGREEWKGEKGMEGGMKGMEGGM